VSRAPRLRSRRARARLAIAACLIWIAGFEVLPWAHIAFHDELAPHIHVGDTIVTVSFAGPTHRHADGTVHRDHPAPARADGQAHLAAALAHGAHSLAHHGVAAIPTPPPCHHPLPIDWRPTFVAIATAAPLTSSPVPTAAARGPPAFAVGGSRII
jgi:hypothetical protein